MKARVLILSTSAGQGHVRAAQALEKAFVARGDSAVEHIDALDYTSKPFQKVHNNIYIALVRRAPGVVGWFYHRLDQPWRHSRRRLALERLNTRPMVRLLERVQSDLCVATHFLPAEIIAWLKERRRIQARLAITITDFDVHAMWLFRGVDRYYVALEETAEYLARLGGAARNASGHRNPHRPVIRRAEGSPWGAHPKGTRSRPCDLTGGGVRARGSGKTRQGLARAGSPVADCRSDRQSERGAAIRCHNLSSAAWKIARLLDDPPHLSRMRAAPRALARPQAAFEIAADCISLTGQGGC